MATISTAVEASNQVASRPMCSTPKGPDNPPRYGPTTYAEYMAWFAGQNYDHVREALGASEAAPGE